MTFTRANAAQYNVYLDGVKLTRCFKVKVANEHSSKVKSEPVPGECLVAFEPIVTTGNEPPAPNAVPHEEIWCQWVSGNVQLY